MAKVLLSIFVMTYAYIFLRRSEKYEERRPWMYLFVAAMFWFIFKVLAILELFKGGIYSREFITNASRIVEFGFLVIFLFSFIYQHHLLKEENILVIQKSSDYEETWFERLQEKYLNFEKLFTSDEDEDPEEELQEELASLEEGEELKKEEEELDQFVKGSPELPETEESLKSMTKDKMARYAEEEYGIELDTNDLKDEMVEQFMKELEERQA